MIIEIIKESVSVAIIREVPELCRRVKEFLAASEKQAPD